MQRKLEALYVLDNALTDPSEEYLRLIRKTEDGEKGIDFFPLVWWSSTSKFLAEKDGGQWLLAYAFESFEKFRNFAKDYYEQDFSESLLRKLYEEGVLSDKELEELISD